MNFNKLLGGLALTTLLGVGLSSCSNDMDQYEATNSLKTVVNKAPKIQAYSGDHYWGPNGAIGTKTRSEGSIIQVNDISTKDYLKEGPGSETEYLDEFLPEGEDNLNKVDLDFLFHTTGETHVELFPVYAQTSQTHDFGIFYYDADGVKHEEIVWEGINPWNTWVWDGSLKGKEIIIPEDTYFGFFIANNNYIYLVGTDLNNTTSVDRLYSSASMNPASYPCKSKDDQSCNDQVDPIKTHAVTWVRHYDDGSSKNYLGFEDSYDYDYQDLVFTMTPEVETVDASWFEDNKENPNPPTTDPDDDDCELCDHPSHNPGQCDQCDNFQGCNKPGSITPPEGDFDSGFNVNPEAVGDDHTNEVEVNLAIDEKGLTSEGKYKESHLSIHVRSAVDVDMFIPMPLDFICPADDLEIVKKHLEGEMVHGGEFTNAQYDEDGKVIMEGGLLSKMTYKIADRWDVSVYVEYVDNPDVGIHIWTEGLANNTELFEYLQETYDDGITFEIWNYFNEESTLEGLKGYLDQTTIKFIGDVLPDYFINAFGEENFNEGKDCDVKIVEEQETNFDYKGEGPHLNASEHNKIYENKNKAQDNKEDSNPQPEPKSVPVY